MKNYKKLPRWLKWSGYVSFFFYWYLLGFLFIILIEELMFPEFISMLTHAANAFFCFASIFSFLENSKHANLRNAREENKRWQKIIELEKSLDK
jgi:hypothetical protein